MKFFNPTAQAGTTFHFAYESPRSDIQHIAAKKCHNLLKEKPKYHPIQRDSIG
ncbi:hypothetical protein [Mannheimia pernigra]|uniref:Uncharacterized protein n=1 Tax=Mannheimia pernigra TaxID=111844 RepID=A0A7D5DZV2_9PAST|nr:hypothetical protein HV559_01635 [Mannheimia pernigra]